MKRFLTISFLLAVAGFGEVSNMWACGGEITYNYYLFHTWAEPTNHYLYENGVKDPWGRSRIDQFCIIGMKLWTKLSKKMTQNCWNT